MWKKRGQLEGHAIRSGGGNVLVNGSLPEKAVPVWARADEERVARSLISGMLSLRCPSHTQAELSSGPLNVQFGSLGRGPEVRDVTVEAITVGSV